MEITEIRNKAVKYAILCHESTGHQYGRMPYSHHLEMVESVALKYIHLIPGDDRGNVLAACWCHDVIEDCRQTYNDVKAATNETVAELVYALTNEKGRTRKERANEKYYHGIKSTPNAVFIKVCDRIANAQYSKEQGSPMFEKYQSEYKEFVDALWEPKYDELFGYLKETLNK